MSDEPKCPACGVAWRDHLGPTAMCQQVSRLRRGEALDFIEIKRLGAKSNGRAATIRRLLEDNDRVNVLIDRLKAELDRYRAQERRILADLDLLDVAITTKASKE